MRQTILKILKSKSFLIPVVAFLLYTLIGFFIVPLAIRWYVPRYAKENFQCQAKLSKVRVNPYLWTVEAKGFSLNPPNGPPLMTFQRLFFGVSFSSLFHWTTTLRELSLNKPVLEVVVEPDGKLNLQRLIRPSQKPEKSPSRPFPLILRNFAIKGGEIKIIDRRQSKPSTMNIGTLNIKAKNLSTVKDQNGMYSLTADIKGGGTFHWQGAVTLSPLRSTGKLDFSGIRAKTLWGFLRDRFNLGPPTGRLNVTTSYQLDASRSPIQFTMDGIGIGLSNLSLKLIGTGKPFLELKKADLIATRFDVTHRDLRIKKFLVDGGKVDVSINKSGHMNLQRIIRQVRAEHLKADPAAPSRKSVADGKPAAPPAVATEPQSRLKADAIEIKNVAIAFSDASRPTPVRVGISRFDLNLKADMATGPKTKQMELSQIGAQLGQVKIGTGAAPASLFSTDKLVVEGGACNLDDHSITVSRITLSKGHLDVSRDKDGRINWLQLFGSREAGGKSSAAKSGRGSVSGWKFLVKSFAVDNFVSRLSDFAELPGKPLYTLQNIDANVTDIDGKSPMNFTAAFAVEQGGNAKIEGRVDPSAHSGEAKLDVNGLVLTPLQPYLKPFVTLVMRSAQVSAQGTLRYGPSKGAAEAGYEGSFRLDRLSFSQPNSEKTYLGWNSLQIPRLKMSLHPNALEVPELTVSKPVGELIIEPDRTLSLARIFKSQKGQEKMPAASRSMARQGKGEFRFRISRIKVEEGNMAFADLSLKPNFKTRIDGLKGTITGLSSDKIAEAKIRLEGGVNRYGFARINGVIRPFEFKRLADIRMVFQNVGLTTFSPYSGKYAGRTIKSGTLSANLRYKIQNSKMIGNNEIILDNLLLGKHVESRSAVNLPLDLAIALLKGPDGRINIALPVQGNLDHPQFSIGPLLWKAFRTMITHVVTAPFRAIGALLGGKSKQPSMVKFDPGRAELHPPEKEKLAKLAEALRKRPELKLVIQGVYSPAADGKRLKEFSVRRSVANRLGIRLSPNEEPGPLDFGDSKTQEILQELYVQRFGKKGLEELNQGIKKGTIKPRLSKRQMEEAASKKRGFLSEMVSDLKLYKIIPGARSPRQAVAWAGELYARLVESEKLPVEALLGLADKRAGAVAKELETTDRIPPDRLSVKKAEPQSGAGETAIKLALAAR